jgi:thiol-disulfide isomerase/thioredoxin
MKIRSLIFILTILFSHGVYVSCGESNHSLSRLPNAPNFVLKDLNDRKVKLSDFKGKVVVLNFWTTWCPPCRAEIPHFMDLYTAYRNKGMEVVGIALEPSNVRGVKEFVQRYRISYPVLIGDSKVSSDYGGIMSIPTTFVITQDGKVFRGYEGYQEREILEKDVQILLRR